MPMSSGHIGRRISYRDMAGENLSLVPGAGTNVPTRPSVQGVRLSA